MKKTYLTQFIYSIFLLISLCHPSLAFDDILYDSLKNSYNLRATSMGNAYTGIAQGSGSTHFNPAGISIPGRLLSVEKYDINNVLFSKNTFEHLYINPFTISRKRLTQLDNDSVDILYIGYGKRGNRGVNWGVNYKSIKGLSPDSIKGWTSDLGLLVHFTPQLDFGILARDVFKKSIEIPTTFQIGFALSTPKKSFILSTDLVQHKSNNQSPNNKSTINKSTIHTYHGVEWVVAKELTLRGGYFLGNITSGARLTINTLGIKNIEYGVVSNQDSKESTYMFSFNFGKGVRSHPLQKKYASFKEDAYARFTIGGSLVDGKSQVSLRNGKTIGTNDLITMIHHANNDPSCKGYLIRVGSISSSLSSIATIQGIRNELLKGKKKGKRIVVYLENMASLPEYYLATVSDKIVMPELGSISHLGIDLEIIKTKTFLENFGLGHDIISSGAHKDSLLPFSDTIKDADLWSLENVVGDLYDQVLSDIKASRSLNWTDVNTLFDGRIISAKHALNIGLIDELSYWDENSLLKTQVNDKDKGDKNRQNKEIKNKIKTYSLSDFYKQPSPLTVFHPFNRIAVIEIDGMIHSGNQAIDIYQGKKRTGSETITTTLKKINKDLTIKGVIIRVNSSGGSLLASDEIYHAIDDLKTSGKTVYTSMGNMATSGGYYVSLNSHKIYANPGTLTGSIGVMSIHKNIEGLNTLLGIERKVIKTGKYTDMMSINKALTSEEKTLLSRHQNDFHHVFIQRLMSQRSLNYDEANDLSQGQLITGKEAKKLHLIDEIGNFFDTVKSLSKEIKISSPELVFYRPEQKLYNRVLKNVTL